MRPHENLDLWKKAANVAEGRTKIIKGVQTISVSLTRFGE